MKENNYFLPPNYKTQKNMIPWDDTPYNNEAHQKEVYLLALDVLHKFNLNSVIDIGTGSGYKLIKYFKSWPFIGVDLPPTVAWLNKKHPQYDWREWCPSLFATCNAELLICSDVIEHIEEPDFFLQSLQCFSTVKKFVISTPDRELVRGPRDIGPPANPAHYREWTRKEFKNYLQCFFRVDWLECVQPAQGTMVAICSHV